MTTRTVKFCGVKWTVPDEPIETREAAVVSLLNHHDKMEPVGWDGPVLVVECRCCGYRRNTRIQSS